MVGKYCCVINCFNRSHDRSGKKLENGVRFYSFPAWKRHEGEKVEELTKRRRMAWIAAVKRKDLAFDKIPAFTRVCSAHFHSGQPAYEMLETHPDWVPSLKLGHGDVATTMKGRLSGRLSKSTQRPKLKRKTKKKVQTLGNTNTSANTWEEPMAEEVVPNPEECGLCQIKEEEINSLLEENRRLKQELERSWMKNAEAFFKDDDVKVKYYTGLPSYATFLVLMELVLPLLAQGKKMFTPFQMLLIMFMRLRLDLPNQHIAYLFDVHKSTITSTFNDSLSVLYSRLSSLVLWPERESLLSSMPHQFVEAFGNRVAIIVSCFEVLLEKPSNLQARAQTFSSYEHRRAQKYLVGITPQGVISFISKGWDGRTSDKHIVENSGFLDRLLAGDVVLADRGFDVKERVGMMCAEVKVQLTNGRHWLDAKDVEETKEIAHLRIYVERVIDDVRNKFKIITGSLPFHMSLPCDGEDITFLDKVVTVCCALTNMFPSVVVTLD